MKFLLASLLVFMLLFTGCKKDEDPLPTGISGLEYFPLETGHFVVYEADSTVYTDVPKDTLYYRYRIKEKIEEKIGEEDGLSLYRLNRYIKMYDPLTPYDSMEWKVKEAWLVKANKERIVVQESNLSFVKLVFPTLQGAQWNGNAYNTMERVNYRYDGVDQPLNLNGLSFNKSLKVTQYLDTTNAIKYDLNFEQYAADAGLIYRQNDHLESYTIVQGLNVPKRIDKGYTYRLKIMNYGKE